MRRPRNCRAPAASAQTRGANRALPAQPTPRPQMRYSAKVTWFVKIMPVLG
jgi:hypothetical protein